MRINTNIASITAQEAATNTNKSIGAALEKLSTGLRINKASDDASGLAIADKLRTQATSINQGVSNGNSAVTLLQIADKSMAEQSNILNTIKAKLIQANTDTTSADGKESIRKDIKKLLEQLDNIAEQTNYNGNFLLQEKASSQDASSQVNFQIGEANTDIISNSAIQSNTKGLGSKTVYSAGNENNTIVSGSSLTLASTGTISLTAKASDGSHVAETLKLSGDVDSVELKTGMVLSGMDASTQAAFVAQLTGGVGTDYTQSGNTFTMLKDAKLDLSTVDSVTATLTTPAEAPSKFTSVVGDIITASSTNKDSDLAKALVDDTKFTDNKNGTYTARTVGDITLEAGESVNFDRASKATAFVTDAQLTLTADAVAGSQFAIALADTNKFSLESGTAGTTGAVYKAKAPAGTINIAANETFKIDTPTDTGAIKVGDMITLKENTVAGSALATALADRTKFEKISGTEGQKDAVYKSLLDTNGGISLKATESLSKAVATQVDIGGATPKIEAGSTITLNADVVAGSDLANQLNNASVSGQKKFDYVANTGNGVGTVGAEYTVKKDFTTNNLKIVDTESITITKAIAITDNIGTQTGEILNAKLDGNDLDVGTNNALTLKSPANGVARASSPVILEFDVKAKLATDTFDYKTGDTIKVTDDKTKTGTTKSLVESGDFIDNGDGSYTATKDAANGKGILFDEIGDIISVKRTVGSTETPVTTAGLAATDIERIASDVIGTSATSTVSPSDPISVDLTTNSTMKVENNGKTSDTLSITGKEEISNGGTQLSALAAVGNGEMTSALASSFQAVVDDAITDLNAFRGDIGSTQNQVESAVRNLMTQSTNVRAAESIIRDVDYASESANFNKQNIIAQAGTYAISQANASAQNVLRLLQ